MMVEAFFKESPGLLAELSAAVATEDAQRLRRAAHTLKSAVGTFGAHQAFELARQLETLGREEKLDGVAEVWTALERCIARLRPALVALTEEDGL
jgi:HPt (histidine-containing phosphotransfer) domain-containing protein